MLGVRASIDGLLPRGEKKNSTEGYADSITSTFARLDLANFRQAEGMVDIQRRANSTK
jgi:hypothetical protein